MKCYNRHATFSTDISLTIGLVLSQQQYYTPEQKDNDTQLHPLHLKKLNFFGLNNFG